MINSLRLQNFRSYKDDSFEFESGVNIVVGPNAAGKTNLLEAIYVLSRGSSFKNKDNDLVNNNNQWARLDGSFSDAPRVLKILKDNTITTKLFIINDKEYKRLSYKTILPIVLFEPNHLNLFIRGPVTRRDYFDNYLQQAAPEYKPNLLKYKRTLAQRNSLLKASNFSDAQLFAWNIKLSELAGLVVSQRLDLIDKMNKKLTKTYSKIANKKSLVEIKYQTSLDTKNYTSSLLNTLGKQLDIDRLRGFTSSGPHREDFSVFLNSQPASVVASRGETRTLLLAIKVFELSELEKINGTKPLLLLDDVFSELDGARRRYLVDYLKDYQTIITTTDADAVLEHFMQSTHKIIPIG